MNFSNLLSPLSVSNLVDTWLQEDLPSFDIGGIVVGTEPVVANLNCKQNCLLAGAPFFTAVFEKLNCNVQWLYNEGDLIADIPKVIAQVRGPARNILLGERPALNCLSRTSGIATGVAKCVKLAKEFQWHGRIACTRKTTPGFRLAEKYAVLVGGGDHHRYDLSSMIMLKDNHITACNGNVAKAIDKAKLAAGFSLKIEVEARNTDEALNAAEHKADVIMLDNFSPEEAKSCAKYLKTNFPSIFIEISGGVNKENLHHYFSNDVDVISMGSLTQGYSCIDFSLKTESLT